MFVLNQAKCRRGCSSSEHVCYQTQMAASLLLSSKESYEQHIEHLLMTPLAGLRMRLFESPGATCSVRSCTGPVRATPVLLPGSAPQEKRLGVKNCRKGNRTKKCSRTLSTKEKGMASCPDPGCSFDDLHRIAALLKGLIYSSVLAYTSKESMRLSPTKGLLPEHCRMPHTDSCAIFNLCLH